MKKLLLIVAIALFACGCDDDDMMVNGGTSAPTNVVYVLSNNTTPGANAVLVYRRNATTGALTLMGTYQTGGTGHANPTANKLGPNDLDDPMTISPDHKRLFAVNSGSNTIAVMDIASDGSLTPVSGSPFPSGGRNPVSVGLAGSRLVVVNKNEDPAQLPNSDLPNYTLFTVGSNGALTAVAGSTVNTLSMASPSQALISRDRQLLFGADFLVPMTHPGAGSLRSFHIGSDGMLTEASGSPMPLPGEPMTALPLGLWTHPTQNVLYVGMPARSMVGVYNFDASSGALSYVTAVPNSGMAVCWIRTNTSGSWIYTVNSSDASISYYTATDPRAPMEAQKLALKEPGPMFTNMMGMMQPTSQPFQLGLSPDDKFIYVVSQRVNYSSPDQEGNKLHILQIASDGTISEPGDPIDLPVPATTRPHGVIVL